jgi:sugar lactone lactonase YvrE
MYYTDSRARTIYLFDYDQTSGAISNQRVFVQTPEGDGVPDGMTVDAEGYVWSARWGGSALVRYTPDGVEEQRITFPAKKVSSVTFGGDDLSDIYVTTALQGSKAEEGAGAGALFRVNVGIRGVSEFFSRVRL